jgi:anthranilate synthase component 2
MTTVETDAETSDRSTGESVAGGERPDDPPRILVVDNYDSFVYNLVQQVGVHAEVLVRRNDAIDLTDLDRLDPDGVVVSPGPGTPAEAGISEAIFAETELPALGVCLGHQALCGANGVPVERAPAVVHGKPSAIVHDGDGLLADLPNPVEVGRYHSLIATGELPPSLEETARTTGENSIRMGVRHRKKPQVGLQFHPESILTEGGDHIVATFCREWTR